MPSSNNHLYPIQALIRPVALRFKYHFEGTRQTNRPDKVLFKAYFFGKSMSECFSLSLNGISHIY